MVGEVSWWEILKWNANTVQQHLETIFGLYFKFEQPFVFLVWYCISSWLSEGYLFPCKGSFEQSKSVWYRCLIVFIYVLSYMFYLFSDLLQIHGVFAWDYTWLSDHDFGLTRGGIRISVIGDSSKLPTSLQELIHEVEETTKDNSRLQLIVAVSYSGKYDVVQACRSIAEKAKHGNIQLEDINESLIERELETNCTEFPYPDLLIRTSGELRVSNFLLWQLAYTELFFDQQLWPDFGKDEFVEALTSHQQRQRRYGGRHS